MDDSYEGGGSGENTEVSTETSTEVTTGDAVETGGVTSGEVASAFDEEDGGVGETDADPEAGAEEEPTTETDLETDPNVVSEEEVAAAFDEEPTEKTTETPVQEEKTEVDPGKTEHTESKEKTDNAETIHVKCTREDLAGKEHPETGVPYETKIVEVNGKQLEVTVPKFESRFDTKLETDQLQFERYKHDDICNAKLKEYCENNPEWAKENFNEKQLGQIKNGEKPEGYTWHHDGGEVGHMQLVDSKIHKDTRHTGGIAIWGNTSKYT